MPGLTFTGITGAYALNPLCYKQEVNFAEDPSGSPSYTAVAVTENTDFTANATVLDIFSAGQFSKYSMQTGGRNYPFHIDVQPQDIDFTKIAANIPNISSPSGNAVSSYQFLMKYRQSSGTAGLNTHWLFALGCRPNSTTIGVTPQQKVTVGQDWTAREFKFYTTSPLASETGIPDNSSITGPVLVDADAGTNEPITIDGDTYPTDGFSVTIDTGLVAKPYNGSGLIDISAPGTRNITGSINVPVGAQGLSLETIVNSQQTGVDIDYIIKPGVFIIHMTGAILTTMGRAFPGNADSILENPVSFSAATLTLATS